MPRHRNNIFMIKIDSPKKVTLSNGRKIHGKYKKIGRNALPNNVTIKIICKKEEEKAGKVANLESYYEKV